MSPKLDLRINGGTLFDGSGAPRIHGDIGIQGGRIVEIGIVSGDARETIDASGLAVAPGFIDMHTHYDAQVFWDPSLSPSSRLGVTTVVNGNCGFSIAPLSGNPDDADYLMRMLARVEGMPLESLQQGAPWNWRSFEEYLSRIEGSLAINAAFMVGHSALRRAVMGRRATASKATPDEIAGMQALLRMSLAAGGLGFSTSISPAHNDADGNPVPSRHASREEMIALAGVLAEFEGTALELQPSSAAAFSENDLTLMIDVSRAAKRALNWNTLFPNSKIPEVYRAQLAASDIAATRGARIVPLAAAQVNTLWVNFVSGMILDMYPGWDEIMRLPVEDRKRTLSDPEVRRKMDAGAHAPEAGERRILTADWANWTLSEIFNPSNRPLQGKTVGQVAEMQGKRPFDAMLDIVVADDLKTSLMMPPQADDDESWRMLGEVWADERTVIGASDGGAHLDMIDTFASCLQILSIGVRERHLLSLEQAVRQLTSVPADLMGFRHRGRLKQGFWADITVFDPDIVGRGPVYTKFDLPGGAGRLYADAVGMRHVIVNGREIVRDNQFNEIFPGRILHSGTDTHTVPLAA